MHLFITKPAVDGHNLVITEERVVHQIKNVLRMKPGENFLVQHDDQQVSTRYLVSLQSATDQVLLSAISGVQHTQRRVSKIGLLIALPNKTDKLDLIVQKTTEVGVDKIIFWPAQRSQLRTIESNRMERLQKIAKEASEQAMRWFVPELAFVPTLVGRDRLQEHRLIMFDFDGEQVDDELASDVQTGKLYGVIGPEGGLHPDDKVLLEPAVLKTLSLGSSTLRMETAAIVAGRILHHASESIQG